jgi:NitT/TauT family transport system substrate-binding protein
MRKLVALAVAASFTLAACGDDDSENSDTEARSSGPKTVRVATFPFAASAPLFLGIEKGFFEKEGLRIKPDVLVSGPEAVTTVVSGENPIGFSSSVPLLIARSQGLPVRIISPGELAGADAAHAGSAVVVRKDSPIKTAKDLEGKTIGVVALKDIGDVTIKEALSKKGADPDKLEFVEIPFPEMNAAIDKKTVDAGWVVEPFTSQAKAGGARVITYNYVETAPDITVAAYFTTEKFEKEDPDTVDKFARAMGQSLEYAQTHEAEVRKIIPTYTQIPPAAAKVMVLPNWAPDLNRPKLQLLLDLSDKYGLLEQKPSLDDLIAQ